MKKKTSGILRIGTSNIVVPGTKQTFPPEFQHKSRLNYYSSIFNSLEINSSFYKVPMASTFEKWSLDVPDNFRFTIKLSKEITHIKELKIELCNIDLFLKAADRIGEKKGCILVQFPGKISFDYYNKVEEILQRLTASEYRNDWCIAIEFRNPTWHVSETFELLNEYEASIVLHDIPKAKNQEVNKGAAFIYIRYHGPKGDYRGSYTDDYLKAEFKKIKGWLKEGKDVYAYFNNTMGSALENAIKLKTIARL
ncbi:MAG: DUF72 domain-containing protein [Ferruginibacter sp.]